MEQSSYDTVRKKYSLPDFGVLDAEFEISVIEQESFVLKSICSRVRERLEFVIDVVERVLQPDPNSYVHMYECRSLNSSEKDELFLLFKQIMRSYRELMKIELFNEEKMFAEFIRGFVGEWQNMRKSLIPFFEKLSLAWTETK
ncbi:hypothetical protein HY485_01480, partial [Candidatus Woesearchaeota archaeon]|nr:hypothetical protein [Candidatus Woesearchaeota archaeon]